MICKDISKYSDMIWYLIYKCNIPKYLQQDAYQVGCLAVIKAHRTYKKQHSKISTWCYFNIRKDLYDYLYTYQYPIGRGADSILKYLKQDKLDYTSYEDPQIFEEHFIKKYDDLENISKSEEKLKILRDIFISECNGKISPEDIPIIIDYYLESLSVNELRLKYGNYLRRIRRIDISQILENVKNRYISSL